MIKIIINYFSSNTRKAYLFKFLVQFHFIGGVLVPFFTDWGGLNLSQTLLIQSWFLLWSIILEIPTGLVADFIGRKQSLYLGALIGILASLIYASTPNIYVFLLGEFLFAMSVALFSGADEAFLYDSLKSDGNKVEFRQVLARYESFGFMALLISAPIGSLIGSWFSTRYSMMLMAIPMLLAFLVGLTFKEPGLIRRQETMRLLSILRKGWQIIAGRKKIQWIALDLGIVYALSFLIIWLYQPLLSSLGVDLFWFGFVHAAIMGGEVLVMNSYQKLEQRGISLPTLLALSVLLPGMMFIIAGYFAYLPIALISIIIIAGFGLTRRVLISEELNLMIPSSQRATVLSIVAILRRFFSAGLNLIVGKLADLSLSNTFIIIGLCLLVFSLVRFLVLKSYQEKVNV